MSNVCYKDLVGGCFIVLLGGFVSIYSMSLLSIGSISNMGPGMFPLALGFILIALGIGIMVSALFNSSPLPSLDLRSLAAILLSVLLFGLLLRPFGLVPAIVALTLIASRADGKLSLGGTAMLAMGLSLGAVLVFKVGLGMTVATLAWPW